MKLHFDHMARYFSERVSLATACGEAHRVHGVTFDEIGRSLEKQGLFPAACVTTTLMGFHQLQGQQTFVVGEHLASMLEHTSVKDVPRADLRMPYETFYVALPGCKHRVWGGTRTQWHTASGMYVHMDRNALTVMVWAEENERSFGAGDDAHVWARLNLRHEIDEDLETMIHSLLTHRWNERNDPVLDPIAIIEGSQDDGITDEVRAVQYETLSTAFRLAINLALYLASPEPETRREQDKETEALRRKLNAARSPGKRKKLQRRLDNRSKATIIRVGASIEERVRQQSAQHGSVSAHWVRGHWHHYWTGKGRTTKVRRWVMPYPKGLEPPPKREYKVENEQEDTHQ